MKWLLGLILFTSFSYGEIIEVEYASFYSHVKKLQGEQTKALRFAFGFQHIAEARLCKLREAKIVTQKQSLPLVVEPSDRFTVPTDKVLKMAKAMVRLDIDDQANQCDMSVQLETQPAYLKRSYTKLELQSLYAQYQAFFEEMGGFLSFMMPKAEGLVFHFPAADIPSEWSQQLNENGYYSLSKQRIEQTDSLNFPVNPLRITALVEK